MEDIKIIDNFLNEDEISVLWDYVNNQKFFYGHQSGYSDRYLPKYFANYIYSGIKYINGVKENDTDDILYIYFITVIKKKIEKLISKKFIIARCYVHLQSFGLDGCFHTDSDELNRYTFCIYINKNSDEFAVNNGGNFFIKIPNRKEIISVEANNNRGLFFPANYYHKGNANNRLSEEIRICFTWKLIEII